MVNDETVLFVLEYIGDSTDSCETLIGRAGVSDGLLEQLSVASIVMVISIGF